LLRGLDTCFEQAGCPLIVETVIASRNRRRNRSSVFHPRRCRSGSRSDCEDDCECDHRCPGETVFLGGTIIDRECRSLPRAYSRVGGSHLVLVPLLSLVVIPLVIPLVIVPGSVAHRLGTEPSSGMTITVADVAEPSSGMTSGMTITVADVAGQVRLSARMGRINLVPEQSDMVRRSGRTDAFRPARCYSPRGWASSQAWTFARRRRA